MLIGSVYADTGAADAGVAYLFSTNGALLASFTNPTPVASDQFGWSMAAVATDRVLIGAYGKDIGADELGSAPLVALAEPTGLFTVSIPIVLKNGQ